MHIGIDFDNTLIDYSQVFNSCAKKITSATESVLAHKNALRSYLQTKKHGNALWTALQCRVYGQGIEKAKFSRGVLKFLYVCKRKKIPVTIISHKSKICSEGRYHDIRTPAYLFLDRHKFYDKTGISKDLVYFEETRQDKLFRIKREKCTHFIDDLYDVFQAPTFPEKITKILYGTNATNYGNDILSFSGWRDIMHYFFA